MKPFDLIRLSLGERVTVRCRGNRSLEGTLHAYDQHLNLVLEDCEETVTTEELDEETGEEIISRRSRTIELLFCRGDGIILVVPPASRA